MDDIDSGYVKPASIPKPRRRLRKALLGLLACTLGLMLVLAGSAFYLQHKLVGQIDRIPAAFAGLNEQARPDRPTSGSVADAVNILLMGTDRRSNGQTTGSGATAKEWVPGAQRTDTLMILHIDGDRNSASIVSIPRDSWVDVPGRGKAKINAAFSYAGPALAVQTVERLTNVRIDHLAVIDWQGFKQLTDALGGVTVDVPKTVYDSARHKLWTKGVHQLDGAQALTYVRQRHGLPGGDFDRVKRQQYVIRALMHETLSSGTVTSPTRLYSSLNAVTQNLSVDSGWSTGDMRDLALSLRHLGPGDVDFMTVPVKGTGMAGDQSVVFLDKGAGNELWTAVRTDRVPRWVAAHRTAELSRTVS